MSWSTPVLAGGIYLGTGAVPGAISANRAEIDEYPKFANVDASNRARPSDYFDPADLVRLRRDGFTVNEINGAGHTVWYGFVDEFMAVISEWL